MKKIKHINKLLFFIYVMSNGVAHADQIKRMEDSWYVGGALGIGSLSPVTPAGTSIRDNKDVSGKLYAGVDISNQIGIEAFWSNLGSVDIAGSAGKGSIHYSAVGVNGVYHLPVYAGRVHPFGKIGIAKINTKATGTVNHHQENNFSIFTGLGVEYDYNQHLTIRAEYESFTKDISQISLGVNWSPNERVHYLDTRHRSIPVALPMNYNTPQRQSTQLYVVKKEVVKRVHTLNSSLSGNSLFATGSSRLLPSGISQLNRLINNISKVDFKVYHVGISGHTDNRGSYQKNIHLSKLRANAVANHLALYGINKQKMSVIGYGESQPVNSNNTAYGRSLNRRVDIRIKGAESVVVGR